MGKEQDWKNLGEQILGSVADALSTGDFQELNQLVSGTVNNVVQEAKRQTDAERAAREEAIRQYQERNAANHEKWQRQQEEIYRRQLERREEWRKMREAQLRRHQQMQQATPPPVREAVRPGEGQTDSQEAQGVTRQATAPRPPKVTKSKFNAVGKVSNVLNTVFGSLSLGMSAALLLVGLLIYSGWGTFLTPLFVFGAISGVVAVSLMGKGARQRKLLKRAQRYVQICGERGYANLDEMASQTGQSVRFVKKDIKKMLRLGMFPEGHMDKKETCFMLSNEVYRQYTETAEAYRMQDQMEAERRARENRPLTQEEQMEETARAQENELNSMVSEGMEYIEKLRTLNANIPGEEISAQLTQLESLLVQIFDRVQEHPEQMHRMHKMMEYYLPTTVKLVEAYVQFEKVENPGKDIQNAKSEILKTLGIINESFTELLNNLFQDEVFDATTDAQVLQTMLSREGLRREMSVSSPSSSVGTAQTQAEQVDEDGEEGEDGEESPFQFQLEPEQPQVLGELKAPWES